MTTVHKKTHKKKKKDKAIKSKQSKHVGSKHVKKKEMKGKRVKKPSKTDPSKLTKEKKKKSKTHKPKNAPSTQPPPGPFTAAPPKKKKKKEKVPKTPEKPEKVPENVPTKSKEPVDVDKAIDLGTNSGQLEKTQLSDDSARRKREKKAKEEKKKVKSDGKKQEEKKKKEEPKEPKEPKVKPVAPGAPIETPTTTPEKKTKSSADNRTPDGSMKKKNDTKAATPEAKTPEIVGPAMMEIKKEDRSDKGKMEAKKENSDPKKNKSESYKLKKTQSTSPINVAAPIVPGLSGKQIKNVDPINDIVMQTPPISDRSDKVKIVEPQRSELDGPIPEAEFAKNHGDTVIKKMEIKKVDFDLIGRTGMYLERYGMPAERKQAFDWIAYNRHDMSKKQKELSQSMAVALSDIGINKHLLMRTIIYLKSHGQITPVEMDKVLRDVQSLKGETVSFSQVSIFLKTHCETYKSVQSEKATSINMAI